MDKLWTAVRAGIFAGLTATMLWHWSVIEAQAEPIPVIVATDSTAAPAEDIFFAERIPDGHWENAGRHKITHYCPGRCCNGRNAGRTASGAPMVFGRTVAASAQEFPLGTRLLINGVIYVVEDRGVPRGTIDVLTPTHGEALDRGRFWTDIHVWKED